MNDVTLRIARPDDVVAIHRLIVENLEVGHLLPRGVDDIARHISRFIVAAVDNRIAGCAELAPLSADIAEVRSLVVDEPFRGRGIGPAIVRRVAAAGTAGGFSTLCAFTHEPSLFVRMGFTIVPHIWVPEKVAHDCTACALFRRCGQHAVTLPLRAGVSVRPERPAATIYGSRTVHTRRLALRPLESDPSTEAVPA